MILLIPTGPLPSRFAISSTNAINSALDHVLLPEPLNAILAVLASPGVPSPVGLDGSESCG